MIKIYQIILSDSEVRDANSLGFDRVPAAVALRDIGRGLKGFRPEYWDFYTPAFSVDTDDLEEAFELTNTWSNEDRVIYLRYPRGHSSSVGDIFEKDGEFFFVEPLGFASVDRETVDR